MVSMVSFADAVTMEGIVKRALQLGESVVVLTHETDGTPHIYNIAGETITEVSQEGVVARDPDNKGDYLSISDIAVTDDGKLVACNYMRVTNLNYTPDAGYKRGENRFYIWDDLTSAPSVWFTSLMTSNSIRSDQGFTMAIKGTSTNAKVLTTGVHNSQRGIRMSLFFVKDGKYEDPSGGAGNFGDYYWYIEPNYKSDAVYNEAAHGAQPELSTSILGTNNWVMDNVGMTPSEFSEPATGGGTPIVKGVVADNVVGKKFNGASYVTCLLKDLMVAPYADAEGKLAGVKVIDITAGFATAKVIKEANLDAPVAATAAATAVAVAENVLTVTLVADAEVHTLTIELDTEAETHTITATANIEERGYIEGLENEGVYEAGDEVNLRAIANEGYEFVDWSNGSKDNPLTFVVRKDETLVANFRLVLASSITLNALPVQDYSTSIVGTIKRAIQNGENSIVLTHEADGTPHIYNVAHATKTVTEISQEGVVAVDPDNKGDYLSISDIALTEDGKLIASNYMRCEQGTTPATGYKTGEIRYYIWDNINAVPTCWFTTKKTANSSYADVSYTFAIKGTSTNAQLMSTAVHNNNRAARINLHTIVNGVEETSKYHRFGLHTTESEYTEAKQGLNFQLTATPLDNVWTLEGELTDVTSFAVPAVIGDEYKGTALNGIDLGKKYNGVSYLANYNEHHLMVAPYANPEGKLAGVKVAGITDGFAVATAIETSTTLETAIDATAAAATAVVDAEGNLTIHLFADAKVYTFTQKEQTDGPATAIDNTILAPQVEKIVRNGQVLIIRDGKTFNMMGQEVR